MKTPIQQLLDYTSDLLQIFDSEERVAMAVLDYIKTNKKVMLEEEKKLIAASPELLELVPKLVSLLGNWAYILDQMGDYDTSEGRDLADKWIDIRMKIEGDE